jgi:hypothetical protein
VFADDRALAKSKREHWHMPGAVTTEPMVAKLARKLLPEHFHARADRLLPEPKIKTRATQSPTAKSDNAQATKPAKAT